MNKPLTYLRAPFAAHYQRGLSLIELMISLTIGLVLLLGVTTLIVQQSQTRDELDKSSRQIENGRYAMQILHDDIQHAGFYGKYYNIPAATTGMPDPCSTTLSVLDAALSYPVQGYNNALPTASFTCALDGVSSANNASNYLSGTDILVIRRVDTTNPTIPISSAIPGQYYLQATAGNHVVGTGSNTSVFNLLNNTLTNTGPADLRAMITRIYFISPCSVPANGSTSCTGTNDDNGHPIPTLKRLDLTAVGGTPTFTMTRLVEGIENMQLDYGVDGDTSILTLNPASSPTDGYPKSYCTDPDAIDSSGKPNTCITSNNLLSLTPPQVIDANHPSNISNWPNVMTVRINLLARSTECTVGYTDGKSYNLGLNGVASAPAPAVPCTNGDYKRHAFTQLVRLINPSGRRAQE